MHCYSKNTCFQPARHSKLEKADILEMAVKHLQNVQRQQLAMAIASDPSVLRKFKSGFNECATEINKYVSQMEGVDDSMRQRINGHLSKCISGIEQTVQFSLPGFPGLPFFGGLKSLETGSSSGDQNNNPRIQIPQGLQLIPSRLPTGEFALLLPNSSSLPFLSSLSTQISPESSSQRPSAFVTVVPSTITTNSLKTPPASPKKSSEDVILVSHTYPRRSPSPQGFRPVKQRSSTFTNTSQNQVPQVTSSTTIEKPSSSSSSSFQSEVKTIRFPIHSYIDKDKRHSPKKIAEPLCIITNQSERYKQAQTKDDSVNYEENQVPRGVKRKMPEHGLLTVATQDFLMPESKRLKPSPERYESRSNDTSRNFEGLRNDYEQRPGGSRQANEQSDMWRPW